MTDGERSSLPQRHSAPKNHNLLPSHQDQLQDEESTRQERKICCSSRKIEEMVRFRFEGCVEEFTNSRQMIPGIGEE